jgi:hypothetical protein
MQGGECSKSGLTPKLTHTDETHIYNVMVGFLSAALHIMAPPDRIEFKVHFSSFNDVAIASIPPTTPFGPPSQDMRNGFVRSIQLPLVVYSATSIESFAACGDYIDQVCTPPQTHLFFWLL